ncbi:putative DNA helicase related protein [Actinacidiphila reveromycinica]|uniref:Putative DNA helicase related protein n=1 Tax=Actinacidiphila reveromycinica TaxID=659352 RepID=A0A7U3VLT5_9ACTN|nr:putative DNA helicase related protein [Streptomyces sp. SN-593]
MGTGRRSTAEHERQADILRYWRAVEYFSPPTVEPVNPRADMFAVRPHRPLPWEPGSEVSRAPSRPNTVWQHTVYAGTFAVEKVRDLLLETFRAPDAELDLDGRISGDSAVLCFTVTAEGLLIKDSPTVSACAWAVGRTLDPGPQDEHWLDGFESHSAALLQRLLDLGDGKVEVERRTVSTGPGAASTELGAVAGLFSRLAVTAARSGLSSAAAAAGAGLGPVGGLATELIEQAGGELIDAAADRLADLVAGAERPSGGRRPDGMADGTPDQDGSGDTAGPDGAEPEAADTEGTDAGGAEPQEPPAELGTKVLDVHDLAAVTRWVAEQLGVAAVLRPDAIRVKSYRVSAKHADETVGDTLLNSFYADDLQRVAEAVAAGGAGEALLGYLRADADLDADARHDVRRAPETVLEQVRPSRMPLGRWPADSDKPLVLSQQFAVNRIMDTLGADGGTGVYAVNGPPGTGKTTMLRDLIAAVVVRRAERLAELPGPELAFSRTPFTWRVEDNAGKTYPRSIHPLVPGLTGFEMVIASSNNGAVENVTLEVPGARAVGDEWKAEADYLSGPAGIALGEPAWGAIAARLGRRSNRSDFVQRFWWGNTPQVPGPRRAPSAPAPPRPPGLQKMLQQQIAHVPGSSRRPQAAGDAPGQEAPLGRETWSDAVRRFSTARRRVRELAARRQEIADLAARLAAPDAVLAGLLAHMSDAQDALALLQRERRHGEAALDERRREHTARTDALDEARRLLEEADARTALGAQDVRSAEALVHGHNAQRPGLLRRIFSPETGRRWEAERDLLTARLATADTRLTTLEASRATRRADSRAARGARDEALTAVRGAQSRLAACEQAVARQVAAVAEAGEQADRRRREREAEGQRLAEARRRWGASVPGDEWRADADDREAMEARELSAPWMDAEFAAARSALFLAALDLHRALLAAAPDRLRRNLQATMDVVGGQAPSDLPAQVVLAAWQMLFLVVPVISTTFASMGRMFGRLGGEALGWLLVDEAGQAAPQEVVGALWRTRRAVVVGDPLQLEPVVTLPWTGQRRLATRFSVDRRWAPSAASVQTLADRLNPYGTWLADSEGGQVWLGSPLRVHRRCDRLMFDVSNTIAYDGMMVYGVSRDQDDFPLVTRSVWVDVPALPGEEKWNPEEGGALEWFLDLVRDRVTDAMQREPYDGSLLPGPGSDPGPGAPADARARELRRRIDESLFVISPFRDVVGGIGRVADGRLSRRRYGTVHTTQGKEADIVVLVLGTGAGQVGSRDWAARTPNLLNVAVTRARRRLVVIGDHALWSRHRYFRDLAGHDRLHRWTPER